MWLASLLSPAKNSWTTTASSKLIRTQVLLKKARLKKPPPLGSRLMVNLKKQLTLRLSLKSTQTALWTIWNQTTRQRRCRIQTANPWDLAKTNRRCQKRTWLRLWRPNYPRLKSQVNLKHKPVLLAQLKKTLNPQSRPTDQLHRSRNHRQVYQKNKTKKTQTPLRVTLQLPQKGWTDPFKEIIPRTPRVIAAGERKRVVRSTSPG